MHAVNKLLKEQTEKKRNMYLFLQAQSTHTLLDISCVMGSEELSCERLHCRLLAVSSITVCLEARRKGWGLLPEAVISFD